MEKPSIQGLIRFCMAQDPKTKIDDSSSDACALGKYWESTGRSTGFVGGSLYPARPESFVDFTMGVWGHPVKHHFSGAWQYPENLLWLRKIHVLPKYRLVPRGESRTYGDIQRGLLVDGFVNKKGEPCGSVALTADEPS